MQPAGRAAQQIDPSSWPEVGSPDYADVSTEVDDIMMQMSLEEKVGQVIQADIASITAEQLREYPLGSILNGGNSAPGGNNYATPEEWLALADTLYDASLAGEGTNVPIIWGTDAVHGHSNIIGATVFPHNIGLGAMRDAGLVERIGQVTAREIQVTGMDWTFAPTVAVARDDRWGRTYESYSEDPEIVATYAGAMVEGLQGEVGTDSFLSGDHVISTTKHFVGDGGTEGGVDQGDVLDSEASMRDIHAAGYPPAIEAGVQSVMASFNSWYGEKMHGNEAMLTDVLVERMGFDGFVVGDWNGHGQVEGCTNESCAQAFNAGLDMFMAPDSWEGLYENTLAQVRSGEITEERLDEAVRRILTVKARYGLFERPRPSERPNAGDTSLLGAPEHRAVAREAVRKSLVLLKNQGGVLPIAVSANVLVTGDGADNIAKQSGGWTITWQGEGSSKEDFPNGQSIYDGIAEAVEAGGGTVTLSEDGRYDAAPDVAIIVFGEDPYAEFQGDRDNLDFTDEAALRNMQSLREAGVPVVAVFLSGRPMYVNPELNAADAFVAAFLPGTEGAGVADVLIAGEDGEPAYDFQGKLSFSWPKRPDQTPLNKGDEDYDPLFAYGYGLTYGEDGDLEALEEVEMTAATSFKTFVRAGRAQSPYRMVVTSETGDEVQVSGPSAVTSDEALSIASVDRDAQEDARRLTWTGPGTFAVVNANLDLAREANGIVPVSFSYNVIEAPEGDVTIGVRCATNCDGMTDMTETFEDAEGQGWQTGRLMLGDLGLSREDLSAITAPFVMRSADAFTIEIADIQVGDLED